MPTTRASPRPDPVQTGDFGWICALYELGQTAAAGADPVQAQQHILNHIVSGLDADSGSIALVVEGTLDQLEIVAGTDLPPGVVGSQLPRGMGVFGHVVATEQPVLVNGNAAETGLPASFPRRDDRVSHSAMCWPLRIRERIIGALAVNRNAERPKYSVADLDRGQVLASLLALVMANHRMHVERDRRILELSALNAETKRINALLGDAQNQVIQSEKLASIGQIAAGVAHEINNPIGFVLSNLGTLQSYLASLFGLLDAHLAVDRARGAVPTEAIHRARALRGGTDVEFLRGDIDALLAESRDGILRVRRIVQDLRDFSRGGVDEAWDVANVHDALRRTINIVRGEVKHKASIEARFGDLPDIECLPQRLHQVFLNLLVNAGQAIEANGTITVSTGTAADEVWVRVEDTGRGIEPENLHRIFEPFYTTKPVGQGTGLGLSVSYSIVQCHRGRIEAESEPGRGTRFTVVLPMRRPGAEQPSLEAANAGAT
ncbi:two-component system, NtrC family, sensor kinase [Burkholderiales bacterium]|nr:two-component system, NtrC family, sensor kinase [Burkholderiales bacterium]